MNKLLLFISGRRGQWKRLKAIFGKEEQNASVLWLHCASLGEFEQGRPVLEAYRMRYPDHKILLTFFSPSGYEVRKNTPLADYVFYLPVDSPRNARRFLNLVRPSAAVFVKYEFWYFYLAQLKKREVPTYLISARFRPEQPFFKKYGVPFRRMLTCFTHLFVQDADSLALLSSLGPAALPVTVAGDTRFDRVTAVAARDNTPDLFRKLVREPVLIAGSTWPEDEILLEQTAREWPSLQIILAPHEIHPRHLSAIARLFEKRDPVFFSSAREGSAPDILVIDSIGMLSSLYRYATVCYIGGGFNTSGIHNTLEAAVYGKPVLFGPNYKKFKEAYDLIACGAAAAVDSPASSADVLKTWLEDPQLMLNAGKAARDYVFAHKGATDTILDKMADRVR